MPIQSIEFGYYPHELNIRSGPISIETLPELRRTVQNIETSDAVDGDWIYAPRRLVRQFSSGNVSERPFSSRVFHLPNTHRFSHLSAYNDNHLTFLVWVLSFFTGMRLTSLQAGFVDSTPIKRSKLVDFVVLGDGLERALILADAFWATHRAHPEQPSRLAAAIHALFLAQHRQHLQFEEFLLLFAAQDACFSLAAQAHKCPPRLGHARRIAWMCDLFAIPVPDWADPAADGGAEAAIIRNSAVHEALFMGEPFGFAIHGIGSSRNMALEMRALICRLLVALIGVKDASYIRSSVGTRQRYGLRIS